MSTFLKHISLCIPLIACSTIDRTDVAETDQAVTCPVPTIDPARSLEITDPTVLANFSLHRVMAQILGTATGATNTPLDLWRSWMATFTDCSDPSINTEGYDLACRPDEASLASVNPFNATGVQFVPVALANRFDLAPKNGDDCGEYRIVYAMQGSTSSVSGRGFLIFEGRLDNPEPAMGIGGCAPIADFWAQLSTISSAATRASKLEDFYFNGITFFPSSTPSKVVQAHNYGLPAGGARQGQIRTNMFINGVQWNLREFRLAMSSPTTLAVQHVTVKVNPAGALFKSTHPLASSFHMSFPTQICSLSGNDPAQISMKMSDNDFNKFESVSSSGPGVNDVLYSSLIDSGFRSQLATQMAGLACSTGLTVNNVLDRATTQTCAGCHELSNSAPLGNGMVWPPSNGFTQIDEHGTLSPALTGSFLPHRANVLSSFLNDQCLSIAIIDDGLTLSNTALDAAN